MPSTRRHHHHITRKELKQPDEFLAFFEAAREFLIDNVRQVVISATVVLVFAAIAIGTYLYESRGDRIAGEQFQQALSALNDRQYKTAAEQFAKLAQSEPRRRVGRLSRFYLGCAYMGDNDLAHAREAFVSFVGEEHDSTYANLALTNLGVIYERMGDYAKAAGAYQQASTVPGPEQTRAQLGVARMLAKQGAKEGAIAAYQAFLSAHPFASQRQEVIESLAMLGASPKPLQLKPGAPASGSLPVAIPGASSQARGSAP